MSLFLDALRRAGKDPVPAGDKPAQGAGTGVGAESASPAAARQSMHQETAANPPLEALMPMRAEKAIAPDPVDPAIGGAAGSAPNAQWAASSTDPIRQPSSVTDAVSASRSVGQRMRVAIVVALLAAVAVGSHLMGLWDKPAAADSASSISQAAGGAAPTPSVVATAPNNAGFEPGALASAAHSVPSRVSQPEIVVTAAQRIATDSTPKPSFAPRASTSNARGPAKELPEFIATGAATATLNSAYANLRSGRLEEAEQGYLEVLNAFAEERDALLGLAYIAHRTGRGPEAAAYYRRVLRQDPSQPAARAGLLALSDELDPLQALQRATEMAERYPESPATQHSLAGVLVKQGRIAEAAQVFARAQALAPGHAGHAYNLAVALDQLHDYARAQGAYARAIELSALPAQGDERSFSRAAAQQRLDQLRAATAVVQGDRP